MSDALANFHFLRPACLLLVPVAIAVWWFWERRTAPLRGWKEQMHPDLLRALVVGKSDARQRTAYWLLAAWVLAAIAVAGPAWRLEPNPFLDDAQPLMILLKTDHSMTLADPAPAPLQRAQLKISDLAEQRSGQPLGLIAYAGSAHLVLPPTKDTSIIGELAAELSPDIMPQPGDRLDLAIAKAIELLEQQQQGGALLVIANAVEIDPATLTQIGSQLRGTPVQFLAMTASDSPEYQTIQTAATAWRATVQPSVVDDSDIASIVRFAEHRSSSGVAGETSRWQEAGYWLTPWIGLIVAFSFRRQRQAVLEQAGETS